MNITIIGAGNLGFAMAAHLSLEGHRISLWNRSKQTIEKLMKTQTIHIKGIIQGDAHIHLVTDDLSSALHESELVLVTTPASAHKELAEATSKCLSHEPIIVLNPGRTFGAIEFHHVFRLHNSDVDPIIAETQTTIYTCRKINDDTVSVLAMKDDVLIASLDMADLDLILKIMPSCLKNQLIKAQSIIQTSIGNVGMVLHCSPILLNVGWTENPDFSYNYYHQGITPTISRFLEKLDEERVAVSIALGCRVLSTKEWFEKTYHIVEESLYDCIQKAKVYDTIEAPTSLSHRYIHEDIPCGLVPLEIVGKWLGLPMTITSLIIDLANQLLDTDFRKKGRNLQELNEMHLEKWFRVLHDE